MKSNVSSICLLVFEFIFVASIPMNGFYTLPDHGCYNIDNFSSPQNDNPLQKPMLPAAYLQPLNMIAELDNKNHHVNYNPPAPSTNLIPCSRRSTDDRRPNFFSTLFGLPGTVVNSLLNGEITI